MMPSVGRLPVIRGLGDYPIRLGLVRMTYGATEHPAIGSWLARAVHAFLTHPRCGGLEEWFEDRAPVYAARNHAVEVARAKKLDYLVMVDADGIPDCVPNAPPFLDVALTIAMRQNGPCVVSAPVPMASGHVNVHREETDADGTKHLSLLSLMEVKDRHGVEPVPATGTGLILFDMRCFEAIEKPYFYFSYADPSCSEVAAGEDVSVTARLHEAGIPIFVAWDSWCGHRKGLTLGKPG